MIANAPVPARRCPSLAELPPPPPGRTGWPWTVETVRKNPPAIADGDWPLLTIVTPSYNQVDYLEETIRSVLLQGYPNLEYLVMDGGSTDGSVAIIEKYAPWLSHWQSQRDGGQAAAIADGFARGRGAIMSWINSDDRFLPGAFLRAGRFFLKHPAVIFANGDVNLTNADGSIIKRLYAVRPMASVTLTLSIHGMHQQGAFWRRSAYEQVGGVDPSFRFCMDRDLFVRLAQAGPSRRIPGPPMGDFRLHEEAKTALLQDVRLRESSLISERYGSPLRTNPIYKAAMQLLWGIEQRKQGVRRRFAQRGWDI